MFWSKHFCHFELQAGQVKDSIHAERLIIWCVTGIFKTYHNETHSLARKSLNNAYVFFPVFQAVHDEIVSMQVSCSGSDLKTSKPFQMCAIAVNAANPNE